MYQICACIYPVVVSMCRVSALGGGRVTLSRIIGVGRDGRWEMDEAEESVTDARAAGTHTSRMAWHGFQQTFTRIGVTQSWRRLLLG